jgi:hypothetical protein
MLEFIDATPLSMFIIVALALGLAPFVPEPHLFEKTRMLFAGLLIKPIDIFDLIMHLAPIIALIVKLVRMYMFKS